MFEENYKKFVLYFDELNDKGIPYSLGDLKGKAVELNLPFDYVNEVITKFMSALNKNNESEAECWKTKIKTAEQELETVNDEITEFKKTKREVAHRTSGENLELVGLKILQTRLTEEIEFMKNKEDSQKHVHDK